MTTQTLKTFREIYPNFTEWENKIITPITIMFGNLPSFLDDTKTFYSRKSVFEFLYNRYDNSFAKQDDGKNVRLLQNALITLLPTLHINSIKLTNEFISRLDLNGILSTTEKNYNDDPDNNFLTSIDMNSQNFNDTNANDFDIKNVREKNKSVIKDASIQIKELEDVLTSYKEFNFPQINGLIYDFVNSYQIQSLFTDLDISNTEYKSSLTTDITYKFFDNSIFNIVNNQITLSFDDNNLELAKKENDIAINKFDGGVN